MADTFDTGFFQLNDIILDIPPEHIHVSRQSFNHQWQTLRTTSSIKMKSGFSQIDISFNVLFTDQVVRHPEEHDVEYLLSASGYQKLSFLVSQFRVTPFCYVENQHLRDVILGGDKHEAMALALKQMNISKQPVQQDGTNIINVEFNFAWFNYHPFSKSFSFKEEIFSYKEVRDPIRSKAWQLMYQAERRRRDYTVPSKLSSGMTFNLSEFNMLGGRQIAQLRKEQTVIRQLANTLTLDEFGDADANAMPGVLREIIADALKNDEKRATALTASILSHTTSMGRDIENNDRTNIVSEIKRVLKGDIQKIDKIYALLDTAEWKPVMLASGQLLTFPSTPQRTREVSGSVSGNTKGQQETPDTDPEQTVILERQRKLVLDDDNVGLLVNSLTISFQNTLAVMPMIGHPYPSYQHIGSIDAVVTLGIVTTHSKSVRTLSQWYSLVETQAFKYKIVPQNQRNLIVENDVLSLCGLSEFLIDSMVIDTVQGQPGTFVGRMTLIDNPIGSEDPEKLIASQGFTTKNDTRVLIAEAIMQHLVTREDVFKDIKRFTDSRPKKVGFTSGRIQGISSADKLQGGAYRFKKRSEKRSAKFKALCLEYAGELTDLLDDTTFQLTRGLKFVDASFLPALFALTNEDVIGIERVQEDMLILIKGKLAGTEALFGNEANASFAGDTFVAQGLIQSSDELQAITLSKIRKNAQAELDIRDRTRIALHNQAEDRLAEGAVKVGSRATLSELEYFGKGTLINSILSDWILFVTKFLDGIQLRGDLALEEFKDVRALLQELPFTFSSDSYPDFPLEQILDTIELTAEGTTGEFTRLADKHGLAATRQNFAGLIQPDFYFYEAQNDSTATAGGLIPHEVIAAGIAGVEKSANSRINAERTWFQEDYDKNKLGQSRANSVEEYRKKQIDKDPFWGKSDDKTKQAVQEYLTTALSDKTMNHVYPIDLPAIGQGLAPAIALAKNNSKVDKDKYSQLAYTSINDKNDPQFTVGKRREPLSLDPVPYWAEAQHRLGIESIKFFSESGYQGGEGDSTITIDPKAAPIWHYPTPLGVRRITSRFGKRTFIDTEYNRSRNRVGQTQNHAGIDIAGPKKAGITAGTPVFAAADGIITKAYVDEALSFVVRMQHNGNFTSSYKHLEKDFLFADVVNNFPKGQKLKVRAGTTIGTIAQDPGTAGKGAHLHFEIKDKKRAEGDRLVDPEEKIKGTIDDGPSRGPLKTIDATNQSLLTKSIDQFEKGIRTGQGYGMVRAYPTFRLFFIESDLGERKRHGFDDFFSYSAVKEIQVIRSRKIAADLCVLTLTNVSGVLSNRKFRNELDKDSKSRDLSKPQNNDGTVVESNNPALQNTAAENPLRSLMLQPGTQLQLRLGYNSNPGDLEPVFNGVITDVQFTEADDLVQVTCQSFAIELVQNYYGKAKTFGGFLSKEGATGPLLENILSMPEVVHFGRWEGGAPKQTARSVLTNRWVPVPQPQDDNIFAPAGRGIYGLFDSTNEYVLYQSTLWDVFQEMTLRWPSYCAYAVPYEGKYGPRMTMFFGIPDQMYFARDPTFKEDAIFLDMKEQAKTAINHLTPKQEAMKKAISDKYTKVSTRNFLSRGEPGLVPAPTLTPEELDFEKRQKGIKLIGTHIIERATKTAALDKGIIKPFRNYHLLSSTLHILENNINNSLYNTFNAVTLQYGDNEPDVNDTTNTLEVDDVRSFSLRCDAALADEDVREMFAQYPNCVGFENAKRYTVGLLFNSLKEGYKGNVVIIGNPKIKPFDICYMFDEYTDMFGPFEVEQVVHKFSQQNGFITEITPDMLVHVNQETTLSTSDAMGLMIEHGMKKMGMDSIPGLVEGESKLFSTATGVASSLVAGGIVAAFTPLSLGIGALLLASTALAPVANMFFNADEHTLNQGASTNPFGMIGAFIFSKLITRTQMAHPFRYSPLVKNSRPMAGGLPTRVTDGTFIQEIGNWFKEAKSGTSLLIEDTYDRLRPSNWLGRDQGDFSAWIKGEEI